MKKKRFLKIVVIVLIIICSIFISKITKHINSIKTVDGVYTQADLNIITEDLTNYLSDKITPKGMSKLYGNYNGENDLNDIYRSLYKFVNYLPKISEKIKYDDADSIKSYYNKNEEDIKTNIGIENEQDFINFIGYLKIVGYNGQSFIDCQLDSSTFKSEDKYFSFNISFNFKELNNEFKLTLNFANNSSIKPKLYYSIIED